MDKNNGIRKGILNSISFGGFGPDCGCYIVCDYNSLQNKNIPIKTNPHYTEEEFFGDGLVVFGDEKAPHDSGVYLDRMYQWDSEKYDRAYKCANNTDFTKGCCYWWEAWLSFYLDKKVEIVYVKAGVQRMNGYSWTAFGYKEIKEAK